MNIKNYSLGFGAVLAIAIALYYLMPTKGNSGKSTRIECQKEVTTFERIYEPTYITQTIDALKSGNIQTKYRMQFAVHTPTKMGQYFTIDEVNNNLLDILAKYHDSTISSSEPLVIDYFVYENDINDPGKKSEEAKKYAGYIRMNFYLGTKRVYSNQIDFMNFEGKDINERLECAIDSLATLK